MPSSTTQESEGQRYSLRDFLLQIYCRILITLLFLFFYALSIGPLYWAWYDAQSDGRPAFLTDFFYPLQLLCRIQPVGDFIEWYIRLWI